MHAAMMAWGFAHPEAILLGDRATPRLTMAQSLLEGLANGNVTAVLTKNGVPGDYAWHAALLWLTGGSLAWVAVLQCALFGYSLRQLWLLAFEFGATPAQSWMAIAAYAAIPVDISSQHVLNSEACFTPLLIVGTRHLLRLLAGQTSLRLASLSGLCLGLSALTRPEILPWLMVAVGLVALGLLRSASVSKRHAAGWFVALTLPLAAWVAYQGVETGVFGLGRSGADSATTIALRVSEIHALAPGASIIGDPGRLGTLVQLAGQEPQVTLRVTLGHIVKTVFLPENLDIPAYFGLFQRTGTRAALVESQGLGGAFATVFTEMPGLVTWLLAEIGLFGLWWLVVLFGVRDRLRAPDVGKLGLWLLLALPALCVLERVVSEGNSRKRSIVDFSLGLFFAFGWPIALQRIRRFRAR